MQISITLAGLDTVRAGLAQRAQDITAAQRVALNRTVRGVHTDLVAQISAATGISPATVAANLRVYEANDRYPDTARIIPSGRGIPVREYRHSAQPAGAPTRARILVSVPGGTRRVAGFINPLGKLRAPLRTFSRSGKGRVGKRFDRPTHAIGPSMAVLIRDVVGPGYSVTTAQRLRAELERELS